MKNKTILSVSICTTMLLSSAIASAQLHTSFRRAVGSASDASSVNRTLTNFDPIKSSMPSSRGKNNLQYDKYASGDHTMFARNDQKAVYKYETYVPPKKPDPAPFRPVKRFDGGHPNGKPGAPHTNTVTKEKIPTPHVQGTSIEGGVRKPFKYEIPKGVKRS